MTYNESIEYIHSIPKFRRPLGNAQLSRLMSFFDNPQDKLCVIHIAGTNGKGSTAAMLTQILSAQGYSVGMFTSPYIEVFNERIRINDTLITDNELAQYTDRVRSAMEENEAYVSEFAFITAAAFLYFYEKKCDYVVLETGMGGRLDATNIIKEPIMSVLTSISLDHMQFLGDTKEEIAKEKCGIIKRNRPVVSYPDSKIENIIKDEAHKHNSELVFAQKAQKTKNGFLYKGREYPLNLHGIYQAENAAVVLECVEMLRKYGVEIAYNAVIKGLSEVTWAVRFEFIQDNLVIDGGHNIDGIQALKESLIADGRNIILVMAMMEDKSFAECVKEIAVIAQKIYATEIDMPRCAKAEQIFEYADGKAVVCRNAETAVLQALNEADDNTLVCVCGSLYLAGEIRKKFKQNS